MSIITTIISILTTIIWITLSYKVEKRVSALIKLNKELRHNLDFVQTHIFCKIQEDCIKREDYEMAERCQEIIEDIGVGKNFSIRIDKLDNTSHE